MSSVQDTQLIQEIIKYENDDIVNNLCNNYVENKIKCNKEIHEIHKKITSCKITKNDYTIGYHCIICIEQFKTGQFKKTLLCHHTFHKKCIDGWLYCNNTCPTCRRKIE